MASGESQVGFLFSKLSWPNSGEDKNMVEGSRIEQKYLHRFNPCTSRCHQQYAQAFIYLKLGFRNESRALTISAAFLHQCMVSSIEYIYDVCSSNATKDEIMSRLPCCTEGFYATESPAHMEALIKRYVVSLLFACVVSLMYFRFSITLCLVDSVCF